jgi:hypothetical protein
VLKHLRLLDLRFGGIEKKQEAMASNLALKLEAMEKNGHGFTGHPAQ